MLEQVRIVTSPVVSYVQTNSEVLERHSYTSARIHTVIKSLWPISQVRKPWVPRYCLDSEIVHGNLRYNEKVLQALNFPNLKSQ